MLFDDFYPSSDDDDDDDDEEPAAGPSDSLFSSEKNAERPKGTVYFKGLGYYFKNPNKHYLQYHCTHRRNTNPQCLACLHVPINADGGFGTPYKVGKHLSGCIDELHMDYEEYLASDRGCHGKKPPITGTKSSVESQSSSESPSKKCKESSEPELKMRNVKVIAKQLTRKYSTENLVTLPEDVWL